MNQKGGNTWQKNVLVFEISAGERGLGKMSWKVAVFSENDSCLDARALPFSKSIWSQRRQRNVKRRKIASIDKYASFFFFSFFPIDFFFKSRHPEKYFVPPTVYLTEKKKSFYFDHLPYLSFLFYLLRLLFYSSPPPLHKRLCSHFLQLFSRTSSYFYLSISFITPLSFTHV